MNPPASTTKAQVWIGENGKVRSRSEQPATEFGITLMGFLREERFNVYSGRERLRIGGVDNTRQGMNDTDLSIQPS